MRCLRRHWQPRILLASPTSAHSDLWLPAEAGTNLSTLWGDERLSWPEQMKVHNLPKVVTRMTFLGRELNPDLSIRRLTLYRLSHAALEVAEYIISMFCWQSLSPWLPVKLIWLYKSRSKFLVKNGTRQAINQKCCLTIWINTKQTITKTIDNFGTIDETYENKKKSSPLSIHYFFSPT